MYMFHNLAFTSSGGKSLALLYSDNSLAGKNQAVAEKGCRMVFSSVGQAYDEIDMINPSGRNPFHFSVDKRIKFVNRIIHVGEPRVCVETQYFRQGV